MSVTAVTWPRLEDVIDDITQVIERSNDIGCLAHKDADADSLGSALAFALSMRAAGKRTHPMAPAPTRSSGPSPGAALGRPMPAE